MRVNKILLGVSMTVLSFSVMAAASSNPASSKQQYAAQDVTLPPSQSNATPGSTQSQALPANVQQNQGQTMGQRDLKMRHEQLKNKLQSMTPEQKQALEQRVRERVSNMTPEQREVMKDRLINKFKMMPEQDQKDIVNKMQQHLSHSANAATETQSTQPAANNMKNNAMEDANTQN